MGVVSLYIYDEISLRYLYFYILLHTLSTPSTQNFIRTIWWYFSSGMSGHDSYKIRCSCQHEVLHVIWYRSLIRHAWPAGRQGTLVLFIKQVGPSQRPLSLGRWQIKWVSLDSASLYSSFTKVSLYFSPLRRSLEVLLAMTASLAVDEFDTSMEVPFTIRSFRNTKTKEKFLFKVRIAQPIFIHNSFCFLVNIFNVVALIIVHLMINVTQLKSFHGKYLSNHDFQVDSVIHHTIYVDIQK